MKYGMEINFTEVIVGILRGMGIDVVPESWRDGCGSLWLSGALNQVKEYVDGSGVIDVPFEIRVRVPGRAVADRLRAAEYFRRAAVIMRGYGDGECEFRVISGAVKSAVYENGEEEYRAAYVMRVRVGKPPRV